MIGTFEAAVKGRFVIVRLTPHDVDVESMGFFDVGNGVAKVAADCIGVGFIFWIGAGFAGDNRLEVIGHRHVTGGTVVLLGADLIGNLAVQRIFEIAPRVGRVLELIDDLLMALGAGVVVPIFGVYGGREKKQKENKK